MMLGPETAAQRLAAWLDVELPVRLAARGAADEYPLPNLIADHDTGPIPVEDWPAVLILPQRMTGQRFIDTLPDAGEIWECTYLVRVLAWVRGISYADTSHIRLGYVVAIREALLARKQAAPAPTAIDAVGDGLFKTDPASITENYGDVMTDAAGRTIAGVYLDVTITQTETVAAPATRGDADSVTLDTSAVPPHPAL